MTNETRNRIEAYKKALPEMKERVAAAAFLMLMSVVMMASASFAWITLSRAPEVTGMPTTVAANGNLEIALAQGSTKTAAVAPGESQVGDSSAADDQSIVEANSTWGNLVNVSDPTYGLGSIALRPALLSSYNRTKYPLNGATYGGDGRVVTTNDRYEFASYELVDNSNNQYYFAAGDKANYGVRAISSVGYKNFTGNVRIENFSNDTAQLYMDAQEFYGEIVAVEKNSVNTLDEASGKTCITVLQDLVTVFAQDKLNEMGFGNGEGTQTSCSEHLWYLYQMMLLLQEVLNKEGKAILEMANWQAYIASGDDKKEKTFASIEDLLNASNSELKDNGVNISQLDSYKKSRKDLSDCINGLKPMAEKCINPYAPEETYYWDDISKYVNKLVEINSTKMNGVELGKVTTGDAFTLIKGGDVVVYKGALVDIEKRLIDDANRVYANVKVTVETNILGEQTVKGTVYTDVRGIEPTYIMDVTHSEGLKSEAKGDATAKDTYGLALDVWVRTNYQGAVLTLEGAAKYEDERATIKIDGVIYELYTISIGEADLKTDVDVYQKDNKWYYASTMAEVSPEDMGSQTPAEKYISVIVGYEGENRIWEDWRELLEDGYIEQDAITQGAGSCFIFYADTPTEQAKIMEMLEAFNVAFMDQNGTILGTAKLNTDSAYANQGKVTVPLEVETGTDYTDESGKTRKGITQLTQNTPTMITAIVYLNGSKIQNENVLAKGELQGQLNIQFGTDSVLVAPDNEELQAQARSITATVTVGNETISNGTIGGTEGLEYKKDGYTATVELTVEGEQPENIKGYFVRVINSTQGSRGEEKLFTYNSETEKWMAEFTLKDPGTYAFNTLIVDGVQYTLHDGTEQSGMNEYYPANRPYVNIQGLKVSSASVGVTPGVHMTAESSMNFPVTVKIDAAVELKKVNAQFFNEDNTKQYTAILSYDAGNGLWVGSANINSSDTYTLKYISVDGNILDAPATGSYTLYLGLRANVSTSVPEENRQFIYMGQASQFEMSVRIYDNSGKTIEDLSNVKLYYNNIISPATMTWNGNYYEGVLDATRPGKMNFNRLVLGDAGTISNTSGAPVFMAISLEKPEYLTGKAKLEKAIVIGTDLVATMSVELKNGESADVWAEMEKIAPDGSEELRFIKGNHDSDNQNEITFTLPKEDGDWTLKRLFLQGVYDKDTSTWYKPTEGTPTENNSFILIPNEDDELSTDVVANYDVVVSYDGVEKGRYSSTDNKSTPDIFSVDLTGGTPGAFLAEYSIKDITVDVFDKKGRKIDTMTTSGSELQLAYVAKTSSTYGGYTGADDDVINFENVSSNDKTVTFGGAKKLNQAGEYNVSVFKVGLGNAGTINVMVRPKFTISSVTPTVKINEVTPSGSKNAYVSHTRSGRVSQYCTITTTSYTAGITDSNTVANVCYTGSIETINVIFTKYQYTNLVQPTVTIGLSGFGNASSATLSFGDSAKIHESSGAGSVSQFSWTGNGNCKRYIGDYVPATGSDETRTIAGTIRASELVLKDSSGNEYKVTANITINNPY